MRTALYLILTFVVTLPIVTQHQRTDPDEIETVVQESYIEGVFVNRNEEVVRSGFHPSFVMAVYVNDEIIQASLDMWMERLQLDGSPSGDDVEAIFHSIDVTNNAATVKLEVWINQMHTYTDYLSLYKFQDEWKIVNKIFASHSD
ncbi:MAG: hypothetical protein HKN43_03180 [Rhodothermales bacterium]|nr:hypothetical protein [Rhodothermales bacterium]